MRSVRTHERNLLARHRAVKRDQVPPRRPRRRVAVAEGIRQAPLGAAVGAHPVDLGQPGSDASERDPAAGGRPARLEVREVVVGQPANAAAGGVHDEELWVVVAVLDCREGDPAAVGGPREAADVGVTARREVDGAASVGADREQVAVRWLVTTEWPQVADPAVCRRPACRAGGERERRRDGADPEPAAHMVAVPA